METRWFPTLHRGTSRTHHNPSYSVRKTLSDYGDRRAHAERSLPHRLEGFPQGSRVPGPCCGAVLSTLLQCGLTERYLSRQTEEGFP